MTQPLLTVLMTVYNDDGYLPTAIESILSQTYSNFKFLILDDCSTDDSPRRVESYRDPRIELVRLPKNVGQTAALNIGLKRACTPWIARMDADDYSAPGRFEEQMKALERFPDVRCVGTAVWEFRDDPRIVEGIVKRPESADEIRQAALLGRGLIHGSIVIGREALLDVGGYDERYRYASDRELFIRFLKKYRAINLSEALLGIRRHPGQDSFSKQAADEYIDIFLRLLAGGDYSGAEQEILRDGLSYSYLFRANYFRSRGEYADWMKDILYSFRASPPRAIRTLGGQALRGISGKAKWN